MRNRYSLLFASGLMAFSFLHGQTSQEALPHYESLTVHAKQLKEDRTINVWLPPAYAKASKSLPVLYLLDGALDEDFPQVVRTVERLVNDKKIPPILLVGIANTQRRRDLTGPTDVAKDKEIAPVVGGSQQFRAFIKDDLFPAIRKKYKSKGSKTIMGESLAGLFVLETLMQHSNTFQHYIAFDPSLWWNNEQLVKTSQEAIQHLPNTPKTLWYAASRVAGIAEPSQALADTLEATASPQLVWKYTRAAQEDHSSIYQATLEKALIWNFQ